LIALIIPASNCDKFFQRSCNNLRAKVELSLSLATLATIFLNGNFHALGFSLDKLSEFFLRSHLPQLVHPHCHRHLLHLRSLHPKKGEKNEFEAGQVEEKVVENFAPNINHISDQAARPLPRPLPVCVGAFAYSNFAFNQFTPTHRKPL